MYFLVSDNGFSQIFYNFSNVDTIFSWHNRASSLSQNVQQNFENRLANIKLMVDKYKTSGQKRF